MIFERLFLRRFCALGALLFVTTIAASSARAEALAMKSTWAVVAGVLEWEDPGLSPFPKDKRKDQELFDTLGRLGVPASQRTLLLDGQASAKNIEKALREVVAKAPAGATVLFYYAGHGVKDDAGRIIFATSDIRLDKLDQTGLAIDSLPKWLSGFRGNRVLLLADCCYSGGLGEVARSLGGKYQAVALTSAEASNISTSDWTYSQTLLDALGGRALLDRDDDGALTFGEVSQEVADAMKNREGQRAGYANAGVPEDLVVAQTARALPGKAAAPSGPRGPGFGVGSWVMAPRADRGAKKKDIARVLAVGAGARAGQLEVEFFDYADATGAWVEAQAVEALSFPTQPVGSKLSVLWQGKVYEAKVLSVSDGFMFITYPGYERKWDEWITAARLAPAVSGKKLAQVRWKGKWFDAVVNSEKDGQWCVSYVGYDAAWDECVGKERIRFGK